MAQQLNAPWAEVVPDAAYPMSLEALPGFPLPVRGLFVEEQQGSQPTDGSASSYVYHV